MAGDVGTPTVNPATNPTAAQRVTPTYQGSFANMFTQAAQTNVGQGGSKGGGAPLSLNTFKPISLDETRASMPVTSTPTAPLSPTTSLPTQGNDGGGSA